MELQYLVPRLRLRRQVPGDGARARAARGRPAGSLSQDPRPSRRPGDPSLSLRWRGLEDRRNPLIRYVPWWVVGAAALRDPGAGVHRLLRRGSRAPPRRSTPSSRRSASKTSRRLRQPRRSAARRSSSCWRRRRQRGALQRRRGRAGGRRSRCSRRDLFASGSAAVNPSYDDDAAARRRGAQPGARPRAGRRSHRRSADPVAPLSGQLRAVARARRQRRRRAEARASTAAARLSLDGRRIVGAAVQAGVGSGEPRAQPARGDRPRARHVDAVGAVDVRIPEAPLRSSC